MRYGRVKIELQSMWKNGSSAFTRSHAIAEYNISTVSVLNAQTNTVVNTYLLNGIFTRFPRAGSVKQAGDPCLRATQTRVMLRVQKFCAVRM